MQRERRATLLAGSLEPMASCQVPSQHTNRRFLMGVLAEAELDDGSSLLDDIVAWSTGLGRSFGLYQVKQVEVVEYEGSHK